MNIKLIKNNELVEHLTLEELKNRYLNRETYYFNEDGSQVEFTFNDCADFNEVYDIKNREIPEDIWLEVLQTWLNHDNSRSCVSYEIVVDND